MNAIPLDLWAYMVHRQLRAHQLEAVGHPPAAEIPAHLVNPKAEAPPLPELLEPYHQALDDSGAAVADYLRDAGGRGRHLVHLYLGRGSGPDLAPPLVSGPGLAALQAVVEHLATRKIGAAPVPAPPTVPGVTVKASPIPCPGCAARVWPATPSRPADQVKRDVRSRLVDDSGTIHACPRGQEDPPRLH